MDERQNEVKRMIHNRLIETGEKERLKERLRHRLSECGWKDDMKGHAKSYVREHGENVKFDDILEAITPKGRETVPVSVKQELLADLKDFWEEQVSNQ